MVIISLSLYPIKHLNELFLPYCSFSKTNIWLTSILFVLNIFFVFVFIEATYFDSSVIKIYAISTHSYALWRKKVKFFWYKFDIRVMIIYFCFVLIGLINDYENHKKSSYKPSNKYYYYESKYFLCALLEWKEFTSKFWCILLK